MPSKPKKPCSYPGCPELVDGRYCTKHTKQDRQHYDQQRGSAASRGYGSRWRKYRARFLAEHPLCVKCQEQGRIVAATVVDHITPHKGNPKLFWNPTNHQALCKHCHDVKTAKEDGGFGNGTN